MKRIFDPIHTFIEFDEAESALIDTLPMQRLRRLHQLGLAYLAFPAAEHSRFGHVLGAMAIGERALGILRQSSSEYFCSEQDYHYQRRLLRASLLLHDIGHGPYSHACEAVLGMNHEARTPAILATAEMQSALARLNIEPEAVRQLIMGDPNSRFPVLRELVSGPNLDADRMDYLQRDAYFTGITTGRFDSAQLLASLRVYNVQGLPVLGVDGRGTTALESFVLSRYLMFASIYFHHTTRAFERTLHEALRALWPDPRALDPITEYLDWDDTRVIEALRTQTSEAAVALRHRQRLYSLVAEYNGTRDVAHFNAAANTLREHYGDAVWEDTQEQLLHRLPLSVTENDPTVLVQTSSGLVDARETSDLIAKLTGLAAWRKLYVRRSVVNVVEARELVRSVKL